MIFRPAKDRMVSHLCVDEYLKKGELSFSHDCMFFTPGLAAVIHHSFYIMKEHIALDFEIVLLVLVFSIYSICIDIH